MTKIKRLSTIFIWYGLTIYTFLSIWLTDYSIVDSHYINLGLLGVATISYFLGKASGQLTTLLMLVIGFFGRGTVVVTVYYFSLFGLKVYWPYLPLIILFIATNYNNLPEWFALVFNDKQTEVINNKSEHNS